QLFKIRLFKIITIHSSSFCSFTQPFSNKKTRQIYSKNFNIIEGEAIMSDYEYMRDEDWGISPETPPPTQPISPREESTTRVSELASLIGQSGEVGKYLRESVSTHVAIPQAIYA